MKKLHLLLIYKINLIPITILLVFNQILPVFSQIQPSTEATPNNYPAIFQRTSPSSDNIKRLMLKDVVVLVLANNTEIKNAYLDRTVQRGELAIAEDKFNPDFTPTLSLSTNKLGNTTNVNSSLDAKVVMKIPTGAEISFGWLGNTRTNNSSFNNLNNINISNNSFDQNLQLSFRQPLLRGAGITVNKASIELARIGEQNNIINLKSTLADTITKSIIAYRELLQAQERVKIAELSLKNAQENLEVTKALIAAGRIAPVEIVKEQANIANLRVSLLGEQNSLASSKLALLKIIDIDKNTNIEAAEIPTVERVKLDLENIKQIAIQNQPSYLQSLLNLETNKIGLVLAKDARRWDLSFNVDISDGNNQANDARAGLAMTRTIGDLSLQQQVEQARINLKKSENDFRENNENLDIELQDAIRNINLSFSQLELARQATQLSKQQLDIEREKQKLGGQTRIVDIVNFQNDLVQAQNAELSATIQYLNALTTLDQFLGTTLQTWQIKIEQ
ncbi:TolC family protein [Rivularia sp. UHCC 0363]|uniref:TolC family protein n=1 Tax=Rivularia sp. UHCC 0363 TaxID=3110244 RepID=UPI002B2015A4|nr:TolC family protein [Rivularia sp. UHCC 0363]MEA5594698.1 TolC family protein [Rivularia sp. UHCC 0363]